MLHALDELGLVDNTILVLTTDHGLPFPGAKATLTDRGLGVLLIVRGPGGFLGGHVTDALVSQVDLYPTLPGVAPVRELDRMLRHHGCPALPTAVWLNDHPHQPYI